MLAIFWTLSAIALCLLVCGIEVGSSILAFGVGVARGQGGEKEREGEDQAVESSSSLLSSSLSLLSPLSLGAGDGGQLIGMESSSLKLGAED